MNTPPPNQSQNIEVRLRTIRILWLALFLSVGIYYLFTLFAERLHDVKPNNTLSLAFIGAGITTVLFSFLVKSKLLARAINEQQLQLVQPAYVIALAFCEVPALLGMVEFFTTANSHYYYPMIIAALGQLLHFPKREHVENAAYKR
jgi:predicted transporter